MLTLAKRDVSALILIQVFFFTLLCKIHIVQSNNFKEVISNCSGCVLRLFICCISFSVAVFLSLSHSSFILLEEWLLGTEEWQCDFGKAFGRLHDIPEDKMEGYNLGGRSVASWTSISQNDVNEWLLFWMEDLVACCRRSSGVRNARRRGGWGAEVDEAQF